MSNKLLGKLKEIIKKVYGKVPKDPTDINQLVDEVNKRYGTKNTQQYFDLILSVINKSETAKQNLDLIKGAGSGNGDISTNDIIRNLLDDTMTEPLVLDLFDRRRRYQSYQSALKKVSRLKRALRVFTSNILVGDNLMSPDDFIIKVNSVISMDQRKEEELKTQIRTIMDAIKLKNTRKDVIYNTLKYGDYFIEIIDVNKSYQEILNESENIEQPAKLKIEEDTVLGKISLTVNLKKYKNTKKIILESEAVKHNLDTFFDSIKEILTTDQSSQKGKNDIDKEYSALDDIILQVHKPENVIKISIGGSRIGYLIVPRYIFMGTSNSFFYGFRTASWPGMNPIGNTDRETENLLYQTSNKLADKVLRFLDKEIIKGIVEENPELKQTVVRYIYDAIANNVNLEDFKELKHLVINNINFRFVPYNMMQEFTIDQDDYSPYGTSIIDQALFDAKLLLTNKLSATILRLTRSVERRIIEYEINDRDSKAAAEVLKEKFKKARLMFNDQASIDTIPTMLSPFQDFFLPVKNGQRFVNVSYGDTSPTIPTLNDDIKFLRDELVSYFDIPPAYLGLEENIESKATLFLQNLVFAITVLDYKKVFAQQYTSLVNKILVLIGKEELINKFELNFNIPVILSSSSELEYLSTLSGIWDFLSTNLKIPKEALMERYLPQLNELFSDENKIQAQLDKLKNKNKKSGEEGEEEMAGAGAEEGEEGGEEGSAENLFSGL